MTNELFFITIADFCNFLTRLSPSATLTTSFRTNHERSYHIIIRRLIVSLSSLLTWLNSKPCSASINFTRSQIMHEILTLQLGYRANHVCTHFWNTQESYFSSPSSSLPTLTTSGTHVTSQDELVNHDIYWREGLDSAGRNTYTPRTLIYDLRSGFGGGLNWSDGGGSLEQYQDPSEVNNSGVW